MAMRLTSTTTGEPESMLAWHHASGRAHTDPVVGDLRIGERAFLVLGTLERTKALTVLVADGGECPRLLAEPGTPDEDTPTESAP